MEFESKLIPIMREGIEVIKMICFKELKDVVAKATPAAKGDYVGKLTGAVVNEIFGTPNEEESFQSFSREHQRDIDRVMEMIPQELEKMRIPLTDALRMQYLCDGMEMRDSVKLLERAEKNGILMKDRELPLPHHFIELVRRLGSSYGLLIRPLPEENQ